MLTTNRNRIFMFCIPIIFCGFYFYFFFLYTKEIKFEILKKIVFSKDEISKCNPIFKKNLQYSTVIDGVKYPKFLPLHLNTSIDFDCLNSNNESKIILFWHEWWGSRTYLDGSKENPFIRFNCPVSNCELTYDKSKYDQSEMVIFHELDSTIYPPKNRPSKQRWLFTFYESPSYTRFIPSYNNEKYKDIFNMSATYHINSDFPGFYYAHSQIIWELNKNFDEKYDYTKYKIDFAAAVISNGGDHVTSNRILFINELKKYIKVDIYGGLGKPCLKEFRDKTKNISNIKNNHPNEGICKEIIYHEYKFYFAFENSICEDYITEKFFLTLRKPIIPVVLGAGPYDYYVRFILF
jgi:hypothetical protein